MIKTDKKEIYRYLGYRGSEPDPNVAAAVDQCLDQLQSAVTPRYVFRKFEVEHISGAGEADGADGADRADGSEVLRIAGTEIRSRALARNLRGCSQAYLMAATLGMGPDRLITRASVSQMSRAVILQAAAAAMIEAWCDEVNRMIIREASSQGLHCRPRFSPGYGDFSIDHQRDFAQILRLQKEIGLSLTQTLLMMPSKSVTAVIGLSDEKSDCLLQGCEMCGKRKECAFSRIGL